ncbi:MAG: peptidase M23 [Parcubacteria group bacterium Gr01-1014_18]|nr:MAG: peptidase M23 [Parcubacteria group bacterium Greene0416_36]TSC81447.1 MAG: peptidase M23 [Parcubacteria group bacterium Gr01-1014_18]TSC99045.1 MAG: peptidase M23 [Parcubacteria group bacterium Greene1014_20]TSD07274.1 MAG: peptidase M23 [Parcubacteria group bacterium Greene0714_2]
MQLNFQFFFLIVLSIAVLFGAGQINAQVSSATLFDYYYTENAAEITALSKEIKQKELEIKKVEEQSNSFEGEIKKKQEEKLTIESQIVDLENQMAKKTLELSRIGKQKELVNLETRQVEKQLESTRRQIDTGKSRISEVIGKIHQLDSRSYLEIMVSNPDFSSFFNDLEAIESVEKGLSVNIEAQKVLYSQQKSQSEDVKGKLQRLDLLKLEEERGKILLESEKEAKIQLVEATDRNEKKFQELLAGLHLEQNKLEQEIKQIEEDIQIKLKEKKLNFNWDPDNVRLIWPVPNQGIVTYFHDPGYPYKRLVGPHSGLDLRTLIGGKPSNGVPVRAVAPGVVVKVIRGGKYVGNAVYIAHSDNFMSIYLHLSRVNVAEDQVVGVAEVIAASGGMPGTEGAGLSSGPHLHFETRVDGVPADPLQYLQ